MHLNPETLTPERDEDRRLRENETGVLGNGRTVICRPVVEDPEVIQHQDRAVCAVRPYEACTYCPHRVFTLILVSDPTRRLQKVMCPVWTGLADRINEKQPEHYTEVTLEICEEKPYDFCPSCPKQEDLLELGIDKAKDGWFRRWSQAQK